MTRSTLLPVLVVSLLTGCADTSPPPLGVNDPGSLQAPEARLRLMNNPLGVDDISKKSRQILARAAKQQQEWDQSGPVSGDQAQQMQNMPGMQMPPQHPSPTPPPKQQSMDQMPEKPPE